ncbi:L-rhamnose mutarotase [Devosia submarina]|uniref:L-rhamnose mutarotase n=1 Tax=Devosia submarina TaxID=1173082 RepID=UPI000D395D6B|nr:L-rhamnose mutarotase [Devosia submarina]
MTNWAGLHSEVFILTIRPGRIAEYRRRHNEIWPEMLAALRASGIVHYDIFLHEPSRQVFGHILRRHVPDPAAPTDPVILRWREFMADVLDMDGDRPKREPIEQVFHLTA